MECCPTADSPVITPNPKTLRERDVLYALMWGEVGSAICRGFVFGFMTGVLHLVNVWIDYMGYATMHFCTVMFMALCGAMESMILISKYKDGGYSEAMIHDSKLTEGVFFVILAFSIFKFIAAFSVQASYRIEMERQGGVGADPYG